MKSTGVWSTPCFVLFAIALYGITAWSSEGFYHPDEHFQILEFANYKLGRTPATELAWEFRAQIRSGVQPMLAYGAIRAAEAVGLTSPFTQAFLLRLITGLLCLWMFIIWSNNLASSSEDRWATIGLRWVVVFLWFVPYLSVRFSSENVAALAFWSGVVPLVKGLLGPDALKDPKEGRHSSDLPQAQYSHYLCEAQIVSGAFLVGLSFFVRFQMGFAILGVGAWVGYRLIAEDRHHLSVEKIGLVLIGGLAAIGVSTAADSWLYGKPVFVAYRYFAVNVLEGKAAEWGSTPWWWYFPLIVFWSMTPIGAVMLGCATIGLWMKRNHVMVWAFLPFVFAHLATGHKELRFLFPMLLPTLVMAVFGLRRIMLSLRKAAAPAFAARPAWFVFAVAVGLNFVLLPIRCLSAAQEVVPCWHFLYDASKKEPLTAYSANGTYDVAGLSVNFYRSENIQTVVMSDFRDAVLTITDAPRRLWISDDAVVTAPPSLQAQRVYAYAPDRPEWLRCEWLRWCRRKKWTKPLTVWRVTRSADAEDVRAH
jgi:phosphatidylinositol glycan class B